MNKDEEFGIIGEDRIKLASKKFREFNAEWTQQLLSILEQGSEVWNRWRAGNPEAYIDLRKISLLGTGLSLQGVNLKEANLAGTHLGGIDLQGADLSAAYLHGAILQSAKLHHANLRGAYLSEADLNVANLTGADLRFADLSWAGGYAKRRTPSVSAPANNALQLTAR